MTFRVLDMGDSAFTIEFGNAVDPALQARGDALDRAIASARASGGLKGLIEAVPTFRSLTLIYDPLEIDRGRLLETVVALAETAGPVPPSGVRHWLLPACYEKGAAPDLDAAAFALNLDAAKLATLHAGTEYVVYMLGFLPGFAFMGDLPEALRLPRRTEPRTRVPAGSIAIATSLTVIYPWESPGGWHLIGQCPVPLFDSMRSTPALLRAGDQVRFGPVGTAEHDRLKAAIAAGEIDPESFCQTHGAPPCAPV